MVKKSTEKEVDTSSEKVHYGFRASRYTDAAINYMRKERFPIDATSLIEEAIRKDFLKLRKKEGLGDLSPEEIETLSAKKSTTAYKPKK